MTTAPQTAVRIEGDRLSVRFDRFGLDEYGLFLRVKRLPEYQLDFDQQDESYTVSAPARFAPLLGVPLPTAGAQALPLAPFLFDDQRAITSMALDAKRFACWSDCGLGKSLIALEWARHVIHRTKGRVLIITLNEIVQQFMDEAAKFYGSALPMHRLHSRAELKDWCQHVYRGRPEWRLWERRKDGDELAASIYRRHYSCRNYKDGRRDDQSYRQRNLIVGPGEKEVLVAKDESALFAWRKFIDDSGQTGVNCAAFRNEGKQLSSDLIREAMEAAWERWPGERLYTYVDPEKIESTNPGYCFQQAGWQKCGETKAGQVILEARPPQLAITNYEKMNPDRSAGSIEEGQVVSELRYLAGIVLDESNRLAAGGGKQKWAIIKSSKGIEYKLSCTATPAPNDTIEFASQASFLERMRSEGDIIWTYFVRDPKSHRWTVKRHARKAFFEFMSAWSIYVRDPRRYGWRQNLPEVPAPTIHIHELKPTAEQMRAAQRFNVDASGQRFLLQERDLNAIQRGKLSQIAKGFVYLKGEKARRVERIPSLKPRFVADLIHQEAAAGLQVLVWTVFDAESDLIAEELKPGLQFDLLTGNTKADDRLPILERFRHGESRVLISRASMLGYGLNFQCCGSMIFSGWSDSYVQWYQAIRRAYRFGQTKSVRVHVPVIPDLEGDMLENVQAKGDRNEADIAEMEANYIAALRSLKGDTA